MSSSLIIALEMAGVLGVVLAFGAWELWSLRRDKARSKQGAQARAASTPPDAPAPPPPAGHGPQP